MHKIVNGIRVDMTQKEIDEIESEWIRNDEESIKFAEQLQIRKKLLDSALDKISLSLTEEEREVFKNSITKI